MPLNLTFTIQRHMKIKMITPFTIIASISIDNNKLFAPSNRVESTASKEKMQPSKLKEQQNILTRNSPTNFISCKFHWARSFNKSLFCVTTKDFIVRFFSTFLFVSSFYFSIFFFIFQRLNQKVCFVLGTQFLDSK